MAKNSCAVCTHAAGDHADDGECGIAGCTCPGFAGIEFACAIDKPLLMLSLPNCGSSWLAGLIARHSSFSRYAPEFFNPIRTPKYFDVLKRAFGCELMCCYRNIAHAGDDQIHDDITRTFFRENLNFTKEVFSPFKMRVFREHFRVFVLMRDFEDVFPPKRLRIYSFYEHAWHALRVAGVRIYGSTLLEQCQAAHSYMRNTIERDAAAYAVPVINYRDLFSDDEKRLRRQIAAALGECDDQLLAAIQTERRLSER
jgi:hypothetical protein